MRNDELTKTFKVFSYNEFFSNYIFKYLNQAEIFETSTCREIRIPVDGSSTEDRLNSAFPEIRRKLRNPDYRHLLPVTFTFVRNDGTMITEAWEKRHEELLKSEERNSSEFSLDSLKSLFLSCRNNEISQSVSDISHLLNDDTADSEARKYKCEFKLILEGIRKISEEEPSFACADYLLFIAEEPLSIIEKALGPNSVYFKHISNLIVNFYLRSLIDIVDGNQTTFNLEEAGKKTGQLYSYSISESTRSRILQKSLNWNEIRSTRKNQKEAEEASRLSSKIKGFALDHSSVDGGDKRYTSPLLALFSLITVSIRQSTTTSLYKWDVTLRKTAK